MQIFCQDFDIDLEGAQTVRLLCYKVNRDVGTVIGTCALEVSSSFMADQTFFFNLSVDAEV